MFSTYRKKQLPRKIPKKIHFIWLGSPLPKKYFYSLCKLAILAKRSGFEFNLWVDDVSNYTKAANREDMEIPDIRVRKIGELIDNMRQDPFYSAYEKWHAPEQKEQKENQKGSVMPVPMPLPQGKFAQFIYFVNQELTGLKNLAGVSDLLRYEITRQEGGYYFDIDTEFDLEQLDYKYQLIADAPVHGIVSMTGLRGGAFNNIQNIWSRLIGYVGGSDIFGALPDHPVLRQAINDSLRNYIELHVAEYQSKFYHGQPDRFLSNNKALGFYPKRGFTAMDVKRYPVWHGDPTDISDGKKVVDQAYLQINLAAGPVTFRQALEDYMRPLGAGKEFSFFYSVSIVDPVIGVEGCGIIAGIPVKRRSDKNWLSNKKVLNALDTSSYPRALFTPAPKTPSVAPRAERVNKDNDLGKSGFYLPCNIL